MSGGSYVPGRWLAAAGDTSWLLADLDADGDVVNEVWSSIEKGAGHLDVVSVLTKAGLQATPSFVLVTNDDGKIIVVVRGGGRARVMTAEERVLDSAGASTWTEYSFTESCAGFELWVGGEAATGPSFPLSSGVVRADRLIVGSVAPASVFADSPFASPEERPVEETLGGMPSNTLMYLPEVEVAPSEEAPAEVEVVAASLSPEGSGYDHLFGATINRSVEEAAIREAESVAHGQLVPAPEPEPVVVAADDEVPVGEDQDVTEQLQAVPRPASGLIDSVPWLPASSGAPVDVPKFAAPTAQAAAPASAPSQSSVTHQPDDGEGLTMSRAALAEQLRNAGPAGAPAGPTVQATRCSNGHANPTHLVLCRACGAEVPDQLPITVPRPVLGVLKMSTGDSIPLDRGVLMGRGPSSDRLVGGDRPHLVKVPSPGKDISRNHLEIRLDGWHVLVSDLNSTNGTTVALPGRPTERLRPDQPAPIEPGTIVSLADEVTFTFEVLG